MANRIVTIDFETLPIEDMPNYPPAPVGVAIWEEGSTPVYAAWGHPINNGVYELDPADGVRRKKVSCSAKEWAERKLKSFWTKPNVTLLGHNSDKFDLVVAENHMDLPYPDWTRRHDTLYQLFLRNPHAHNLKLKPAAAEILDMPAEERDKVVDWLVEHQPVKSVNDKALSAAENSPNYAGAYVAYAPGDLVAEYAIGDVVRTRKIHDKVYPELCSDENETGQNMRDAYERELKCAPIFIANEREGMRLDTRRLLEDIDKYTAERAKADQWLFKRLGREFNVDSDRGLADVLSEAKIVKDEDWVITKSGLRSVSKDNLTKPMYQDQQVWAVLNYRNRLTTALGTFMEPWAKLAARTSGNIHSHWNQVRGTGGGTRTGRPSTYNPNFLNIPKSWQELNADLLEAGLPTDFLTLPSIRQYVLPDKGGWVGHRDYNQQEFRILAHYENDVLMQSYLDDPFIDYHDNMKRLVLEITGMDLNRRIIKTLNFGINYGMGIGKLALRLDKPVDVAKQLLGAQKQAAPGVEKLNRDLCRLGKSGQAIRTWGGRLYYCEAPGWSEKFKKQMSFEYKLLNYLIQGSAADCTKEALIRYNEIRKHGRLLVTVYDEINVSAPKKAMKEELLLLREAMESVGAWGSKRWGADRRFDVPMLSDAKMGPNWGDIEKFKEPERVFLKAA